MGEILISATVLICMILLLRRLIMGRISMNFRYALWLLAALRLATPIFWGSSPLSVLNLKPVWMDPAPAVRTETRIHETEARQDRDALENGQIMQRVEDEPAGETGREVFRENPGKTAGDKTGWTPGPGLMAGVLTGDMRVRSTMTFLWLSGVLVVGGLMAFGRIRLALHLRRRRKEALPEKLPAFWAGRRRGRHIHVYLVKGLPSPCLVGRAIYMEPRILRDQDKLRHVLAHEYIHAVHKDALWAFVRSALCALYWFHPLVWVAAWEAKRDSELACDESVIRLLGEKERFAYGRTLLTLYRDGGNTGGCVGAVSLADGRKNGVKERIMMITGKRQKSKTAAALAVFTAILACGCTFTGPLAADGDSAGKAKEILLTNKGDLLPSDTEAQKDTEEQADTEAKKDTEQTAFETILNNTEDTAPDSARPVDLEKYYEYLYEGAECPLEDGRWYQLPQKGADAIAFYGFYTEAYGCRGIRIEIDGDSNTFDLSWIPTSLPVDVAVLEEAQDGMPRSFAFQMCVVNDSSSEIWRLSVADRYDTGTIELYCFEEEEYVRQIEEQAAPFWVMDEKEERKVKLVVGEEELGEVDVTDYTEEEVEDVVWDTDSVAYILKEGDGGISLLTGIGFRLADSGEVRFGRLPLIEFPVDIGSFGEREFVLGVPNIRQDLLSGKVDL